MGRPVGPRLAARFARALLELGGNNAAIVAPSADLDLALRGVAFAAMGTAGQRCTTLRRLFVHDSVYDALVPRLRRSTARVQVGDPREAGTLVGPLIDRRGLRRHADGAATTAAPPAATVHGGERVDGIAGAATPSTCARPWSRCRRRTDPVLRETFAPILYVMRYSDARRGHRAAERRAAGPVVVDLHQRPARGRALHLGAGSDCGIANVNIGPSGAEIGGAFGGEKETGGGREAGSDSWKAYMRRATNTINYSTALPLAQGVTFDIDG